MRVTTRERERWFVLEYSEATKWGGVGLELNVTTTLTLPLNLSLANIREVWFPSSIKVSHPPLPYWQETRQLRVFTT